ncbi:MAG: branched-chain amino acid ABC transporter permease [Lachnospiraceae bacterium]|nr:branched-chain amino acid ABC transporter permease [Lachnospiraceae bacterium]
MNQKTNFAALLKNSGVQILLFVALSSGLQLLSLGGLVPNSLVYALGNTLIYAIVAIGFCLLLGYAGLASLGTAGFIGVGAYIAYYMMQELKLPFILALGATILVSLLLGVIVGFISLRIEGIYLAIMTLGLSETIRNLLMALKSTIKIDLNNLKLFGSPLNDTGSYYLILGIFALLMWLVANLIKSPVGRAMLAMKNSTSAAQAMGISLMKYRLLSFVIATVFASVGGLLYMVHVRTMTTATSTLLTLTTSLNILGGVVIGGAKSLWGSTFGIFIIYGIQSMFLSKITFFQKNPAFITMITGLLIILVVMFFPGGFAQIVWELKMKWKGRKRKGGAP